MRGEVDPQPLMFHHFLVESRIPTDHPLRRVRKLAESALSAISAELDGLYARTGHPSIPPERLLKGPRVRICGVLLNLLSQVADVHP